MKRENYGILISNKMFWVNTLGSISSNDKASWRIQTAAWAANGDPAHRLMRSEVADNVRQAMEAQYRKP